LGKLRLLWRGILLLAMTIAALTEYLFWRDKSLRGRAVWMQRWSRLTLHAMGIRVRVVGEPPQDGLLVSNHVGYLDVLAIGSAAPFVFVSKIEVKSWPIAGALTRRAGTIFLDRESRSATASVTEQIEERLKAGVPVVMFPEGTSSDGTGLLPFRSSLFEAPVALDAAIHVACLRYAVPGDSPDAQTMRERVAYWGDMSFGAHLPRLLGLRRIEAVVEFSPVCVRAENRKTVAIEAEKIVRAMLG
jgi:1-acyl-sn-glycerol-3-phosphate acyltransferase